MNKRIIDSIFISAIPYILAWVSLYFFIVIRTTFNGGFGVIISKSWLPLAILEIIISFLFRKYFYPFNRATKDYWIFLLCCYPGLLLSTWGFGLGINAFTSSGDVIVFQGQVVERQIRTSKGTSYYIRLIDKQTNKEVDFLVDLETYNSTSIGGIYREQFYKGGLGVPFKWR
jgi:hypothetical protein